jgi:hypothetical protein
MPVTEKQPAWPWWPVAIGGLIGPLVSSVFEPRMSHEFAVGAAFLVTWIGVGVIFSFRPPSPQWSMARWIGGAVAGAVVAAAVTAALGK